MIGAGRLDVPRLRAPSLEEARGIWPEPPHFAELSWHIDPPLISHEVHDAAHFLSSATFHCRSSIEYERQEAFLCRLWCVAHVGKGR